MHKYGESKTTRIMMATVPHVTSGSGLRKFQADAFLFNRVYTWHAETCNQLYEKEKGIDRLTQYYSNQEHDIMQHLQVDYILITNFMH